MLKVVSVPVAVLEKTITRGSHEFAEVWFATSVQPLGVLGVTDWAVVTVAKSSSLAWIPVGKVSLRVWVDPQSVAVVAPVTVMPLPDVHAEVVSVASLEVDAAAPLAELTT